MTRGLNLGLPHCRQILFTFVNSFHYSSCHSPMNQGLLIHKQFFSSCMAYRILVPQSGIKFVAPVGKAVRVLITGLSGVSSIRSSSRNYHSLSCRCILLVYFKNISYLLFFLLLLTSLRKSAVGKESKDLWGVGLGEWEDLMAQHGVSEPVWGTVGIHTEGQPGVRCPI